MREHEKIPYDSFAQQAYWGEGMRLPGQSKGLDRWFFQWQWRNTMRAEDEIDSDEPSSPSPAITPPTSLERNGSTKRKPCPLS